MAHRDRQFAELMRRQLEPVSADCLFSAVRESWRQEDRRNRFLMDQALSDLDHSLASLARAKDEFILRHRATMLVGRTLH